MENALRESEEQYRDLVENISDVIYTLDTEGTLTYVSPAVESFLGYSPSEVIGRHISQFVSSEEVQTFRDSLKRLASGQSPGPTEYQVLTKSGEVRWIRVSSQPVVKGDQVTGVRGVLTDITDRVRAEEQLEEAAAAAERERIASDLHDAVSQTLFSIAAIAEVLPDYWERNPAKARQGLEDLRQQAQGALAEMRTLLLEWRPDVLMKRNLGDLLHQLAEAMVARTRMPITTTLLGDCHPPAEVRLALYRIAQEALNNVVKHAEANRAIVRLQCTAERITLNISDDGHGFDPDRGTVHQMGLRIMRERAQAVGATFAIDSQPGHGTEITVTWEDTTKTKDG